MATNTEELWALIDIDSAKDIKSEPENTSLKESLEEDIQTKLKKLREDTEEDKLKKMTITKEIFEQIKKSLEETVKNMEKNPSVFSRAAEFWGELPLWQKILGGATLTLPTLIIGIATHVGFVLALCGVTAVTFTAGGLILDDHHKCSSSSVDSLQKGVLGLADLLELTINALNVIREQLGAEIFKLAQENQRLSEIINALSQQIDAIEKQVKATVKINESLHITKEGLEGVAHHLTEGVAQQTDLLNQAQKKLNHIHEAYGASQKKLAETIAEVQKVRVDLGADLKRAKVMIDTLGNAIIDLSTKTIGDEEQRKAFQGKLDDFLQNKEASFLQIAERVCDAEEKLARVQKELESTNTAYRELLERHVKQVDRLEGLDFKSLCKNVSKVQNAKETFVGEALNKNGLYAPFKQDKENTEEESQLTQTRQ